MKYTIALASLVAPALASLCSTTVYPYSAQTDVNASLIRVEVTQTVGESNTVIQPAEVVTGTVTVVDGIHTF
jgi:hypothetical protein